MREGAVAAGVGHRYEGRVLWDPARSFWFGIIGIVAVAGAIPCFTPSAFAVFAALTAFTLAAGHSVGVHRRLIHHAFRAPLWLERALVYLGVMIGLAGPLGLIRMHQMRDHQQNQAWCHDYFAHRQRPWRDYFWNLHCRFQFLTPWEPAPDASAAADPFYRWLERTWRWQQLPWALLLFAAGGLPWLVWGGFVRVAVSTLGHWLVGYVAHRHGYRAYENRGAAVQGWNNLLLGAISMGEGWHNNHHAFPRSARLGIRAWELDVGWWLIAGLRALGLARQVVLPGEGARAANAHALG
jgi:stearoyl-CoA desaturase (delta-9 desaturase)